MEESRKAAALRAIANALNGRYYSLQARIRTRLDGMDPGDVEPDDWSADGGSGSGNWGHAGRPGMRGGSMPGGGKMHRGEALPDGSYTSAAKQRRAAKAAAKKEPKPKKEPKKEPEIDKYGKMRTDTKKKFTELKHVDFLVEQAEAQRRSMEYLGLPESAPAQRERLELEEKQKALQEQYASEMKKLGITTQTEQDLYRSDIEYNAVTKQETPRSEEEIINALAGGDMTKGSCASLALAYAGQKQGYNVLDFRNGDSRLFFGDVDNSKRMLKDCGADLIVMDSAATAGTNGKKLLAQLEEGKEYYYVAGRHAAIVRVQSGKPQFLELQSPFDGDNGWQNFDGNVRHTLTKRFGVGSKYVETGAYAVDIAQMKGKDFEAILGYVNTEESKQVKGRFGGIR